MESRARCQRNAMDISCITYRRARWAEVPDLWRVRTESIRSLCQGYYHGDDIEAWAGAPMPDGFAELVHTRDFLVAEQRGAVVGFGFLHRPAAELEALFVAPGFARRGIGTALLRALETIARDAGLKSLNLSASLNSVKFYGAVGYERVGDTVWVHPAGFRLACVAMTKRFD